MVYFVVYEGCCRHNRARTCVTDCGNKGNCLFYERPTTCTNDTTKLTRLNASLFHLNDSLIWSENVLWNKFWTRYNVFIIILMFYVTFLLCRTKGHIYIAAVLSLPSYFTARSSMTYVVERCDVRRLWGNTPQPSIHLNASLFFDLIGASWCKIWMRA